MKAEDLRTGMVVVVGRDLATVQGVADGLFMGYLHVSLLTHRPAVEPSYWGTWRMAYLPEAEVVVVSDPELQAAVDALPVSSRRYVYPVQP